MTDEEVEVATFPTETQAQMWAELLHSEGIPSVLVPLGTGAGGLGPTVWRPFAIRVKASDAARAKRVLQTLEHGGRRHEREPDRKTRRPSYRRRDR